MVTKHGIQMSDKFYLSIVNGEFDFIDIKTYKEKQAVVMLCAENNIPIKVVPMGANVHRIIRSNKICPTCAGKGII